MKEVPLTKGYVALVDDEDYALVSQHKWTAQVEEHTVYAARNCRINGKWTSQRLHRLILGLTDPRIHVDHENHNGLDCRRSNMRIATHPVRTNTIN